MSLGKNNIICPTCKGNGYIRLSWEGDDVIEQCDTCHSQGAISEIRKKALKKFQKLKEDKEWALAASMYEDYHETHNED